MDYNTLLDMTAELGYQLAMCGAETFRIEQSIGHIMNAYGIQGESFAIPNCLTVSLETAEGKPMTRMRRIGYHGNDLDAVEKFSNLGRRICAQKPEPHIAMQWLRDTQQELRHYPLCITLLGNFLGAFGFCILFGGGMFDSLCSGVCGVLIGLINRFMDKQKANQFFRTITASFLMALLAYVLAALQLSKNPDAVIIGALMILVPGLTFTNAMRDIIYGDTNSGINRIVQVFLIAVAIALGTAASWKLVSILYAQPVSGAVILHPLLLESIACFISCTGFAIVFNIHGPGGLLCAAGGTLTWITYRLLLQYGGGDFTAYFGATVVASLYAEVMARIRKYPAISYLVISAFPLIPGAGVYYTMNYAVRGAMAQFSSKGMHTIAIAGIMAVGILIGSTTVRIVSTWLYRRKHKNISRT
jgi:uncharacterized membrane protein YjjP (DUF1212 family)